MPIAHMLTLVGAAVAAIIVLIKEKKNNLETVNNHMKHKRRDSKIPE